MRDKTTRSAIKTILIGLGLLGGVVWSQQSVAGTVTRACTVPPSEVTNPVYRGAQLRVSEGTKARCDIAFSGEIIAGDSARLAEAITLNPTHVVTIEFNSPGGDALEGLRIADVLNASFIQLTAGIYADNGSCAKTQCGRICASACALAFLASDHHVGSQVFIHRPTFDRAMFAGLSAGEAHERYNVATNALRAELIRRQIPTDIIQKMMNIPSDQVQKIPRSYPFFSSWLDEWLTSKCGRGMNNSLDFEDPPGQAIDQSVANDSCRLTVLQTEAMRTQKKGY